MYDDLLDEPVEQLASGIEVAAHQHFPQHLDPRAQLGFIVGQPGPVVFLAKTFGLQLKTAQVRLPLRKLVHERRRIHAFQDGLLHSADLRLDLGHLAPGPPGFRFCLTVPTAGEVIEGLHKLPDGRFRQELVQQRVHHDTFSQPHIDTPGSALLFAPALARVAAEGHHR